jgi:hypothetical protein
MAMKNRGSGCVLILTTSTAISAAYFLALDRNSDTDLPLFSKGKWSQDQGNLIPQEQVSAITKGRFAGASASTLHLNEG